ncbi:MAG: GNAT family N-acetyltransferase [Alphaproteobacteria bacterium]|nr:GNAT family N-acetyltransferase [Alphaproteobacteria bacterium]
MEIGSVSLKGSRVHLIPMDINHLDDLYTAILADNKWQDTWKYRVEKVQTKEDLKNYMEIALAGVAKKEIIPFTIFDMELNKIVGTTRFADISTQGKFLEIGWTTISPEVMRTKVNTECKFLLLKHCFEDLQFVRVVFKTMSFNHRSQQAILRLGAKKEGEFRWVAQKDGEYVNVVYFSIIQPEWPEVKQKLEGFLFK